MSDGGGVQHMGTQGPGAGGANGRRLPLSEEAGIQHMSMSRETHRAGTRGSGTGVGSTWKDLLHTPSPHSEGEEVGEVPLGKEHEVTQFGMGMGGMACRLSKWHQGLREGSQTCHTGHLPSCCSICQAAWTWASKEKEGGLTTRQILAFATKCYGGGLGGAR